MFFLNITTIIFLIKQITEASKNHIINLHHKHFKIKKKKITDIAYSRPVLYN